MRTTSKGTRSDTPFFIYHPDGYMRFQEGAPTAMLHVCPSCFGKRQRARISHVIHAVDVFHGFAPKCTHHAFDMFLFRGGLSVSRIKLVTGFECRHRHSPIVELGQVVFVLRIIKVSIFSGCHNDVISGFAREFQTERSEAITPSDERNVFGIIEQIFGSRHADIVQFAPEHGFLAFGANHRDDFPKEDIHQLRCIGVTVFFINGLATSHLAQF